MPTTQQYWRVFVNGPTNGVSVVAIAEIVFLDTNNLSISTSGGTASASTVFNGSFVAANAFDGNPATAWASSANPTLIAPQWVQMQFTGAVPVVAISIAVRNDGGAWTSQSPTAFLLQSSPDGTTWTTQNTVTGFNWTDNGQVAYFTVSTTVGNLRATQIPIESLVAGSNALVSQLATEAILNAEANAKISQLNFEAILNAEAQVKISQICLEVIYPNIPQTPKLIMQFLLP